MDQATLGVALMIFVVVLGFTLYVWLGPYRREGRKTRRYKLFAVRDELIWLVAQGAIREDDSAFRYLYEMLNAVIPAKPLTLGQAISVLKSSHVADKEKLEFFRRTLEHEDKGVRKVAVDFYSAIIDIFLAKSLFVRIARIGLTGFAVTRRIRGILGSVFRTENEAYELYQRVGNLTSQLQAA